MGVNEIDRDRIDYCIDLGLIVRGPNGLEIANPIYREVIRRELTVITQISLKATVDRLWYTQADGSITVEKLLTDFQKFFREHSEF